MSEWKATDLIKESLNRHDKHLALACSFGKDSMQVLKMVLDQEPNIKVIFENTGVEFPETIKYKDQMKKEWNLNLYETKPLKTFWDCVKLKGLPETRKQGGKGSNSPYCCTQLKEKPGLNLQKELGINAILTGLQSCESRARSLIAKRYDNKKAPYMEKDSIEFCSKRWFTRHTGTWMLHPIMDWSTHKVWKSTLKNKIPINPVYTKWDVNGEVHDPKITLHEKGYLLLDGVKALYPRCGCLPCTAYLSWKERLSISHPKLYQKIITF